MRNRPSRSWAAPTADQCRSPVAGFTDESYSAFSVAVVEHVCAIVPEMGNTAAGAVGDALAAHLHLLRLREPPKET